MKPLYYTCLLASLFLLASCSTDEEEIRPIIDDNPIHTAVLRLDGGIQHFDEKTSATRAATSEWDDGAVLYIQYETEYGIASGKATYSEVNNEWKTDYYGTLIRGKQAKCEVYFFENINSSTDEEVALGVKSACFSDLQASYFFEDGIVKLKTHLVPLTGRVRFHGDPHKIIYLTGLKWYSNYSISTNQLSEQNEVITLITGEDGYTPYVHASFVTNNRKLYIDSGDEQYAFYRICETPFLDPGRSGFLNIPNMTSRNGFQIMDVNLFGLCPDDDHPHVIDLGNAGKWACCNVGAKSPTEYGHLYAWGETSPKQEYSWSTYSMCKNGEWNRLNKYNKNDYITYLEDGDDAAYVNWGSAWKTPTNVAIENLIKYTSQFPVSINGVKGCIVYKNKGHKLFLPSGQGSEEEWGYYWSNRIHFGYSDFMFRYADCLQFRDEAYSWEDNIKFEMGYLGRAGGHYVRPMPK